MLKALCDKVVEFFVGPVCKRCGVTELHSVLVGQPVVDEYVGDGFFPIPVCEKCWKSMPVDQRLQLAKREWIQCTRGVPWNILRVAIICERFCQRVSVEHASWLCCNSHFWSAFVVDPDSHDMAYVIPNLPPQVVAEWQRELFAECE